MNLPLDSSLSWRTLEAINAVVQVQITSLSAQHLSCAGSIPPPCLNTGQFSTCANWRSLLKEPWADFVLFSLEEREIRTFSRLAICKSSPVRTGRQFLLSSRACFSTDCNTPGFDKESPYFRRRLFRHPTFSSPGLTCHQRQKESPQAVSGCLRASGFAPEWVMEERRNPQKYYFAAFAALMASISSGVTLNRSPQMP